LKDGRLGRNGAYRNPLRMGSEWTGTGSCSIVCFGMRTDESTVRVLTCMENLETIKNHASLSACVLLLDISSSSF
jgi:hypothetical protein